MSVVIAGQALRRQAETVAELDSQVPSILDRAFRGELSRNCGVISSPQSSSEFWYFLQTLGSMFK